MIFTKVPRPFNWENWTAILKTINRVSTIIKLLIENKRRKPSWQWIWQQFPYMTPKEKLDNQGFIIVKNFLTDYRCGVVVAEDNWVYIPTPQKNIVFLKVLLGVVVHACNSMSWEAERRVTGSKANLITQQDLISKTKTKNPISIFSYQREKG